MPTNVSCEGGRAGGARGYDEEVELLLLEERAEREQCPALRAVMEGMEGGGGGVEGLGCGANTSLSIHLVDNQVRARW